MAEEIQRTVGVRLDVAPDGSTWLARARFEGQDHPVFFAVEGENEAQALDAAEKVLRSATIVRTTGAYCGCRVGPGIRWPREQVKEHYRHTFQALLLWELLRRPGQGQDVDQTIKLSGARDALLSALREAFPELGQDAIW